MQGPRGALEIVDCQHRRVRAVRSLHQGHARSVAGVLPSALITWFEAAQACRNAGKRLLTNAEWQMAAAGTPDPGNAGNGTTTCNTDTGGPTSTGTTGNCI